MFLEFVPIGQARVVLVATTVGIAVLNKLLSAEERGCQFTGADMVEVYITRKTQAYLSTFARYGDDRWEVQMLGALPFFSLCSTFSCVYHFCVFFTFSTFLFFFYLHFCIVLNFSQMFPLLLLFSFSISFPSFLPRSPCSLCSSFSHPFSPLPPLPFFLLFPPLPFSLFLPISLTFSPSSPLSSPLFSPLLPSSPLFLPLPLFSFFPFFSLFPFFPFSQFFPFAPLTRFT